MKAPPVVLVFCLGATACAAPGLDHTLAAARTRVARVRPAADLADVRAEVWTSTAQAEDARRLSTEPLSYPYARKILREQRPLFELIGLARPGFDPLELLIGEDSEKTAAFVVPEHGLVLTRYPSDVAVMTHELGHIASWRLGYWNRAKPYLWLHPDEVGNPAWIDLDAYISSWSLEEGCAQVTSYAAMESVHPDGLSLSGIEERLQFTWRGIDRRVKGPLVIRLEFLAYHDGPRFVLSRRGSEVEVEGAIEAAWSSFRGTTREIAFSEMEARPSRLGPALRATLPDIHPTLGGATRVGALLLFQCLSNRNDFEVEPFDALAEGLEDDLVLTWDTNRHLWLTLWRDETTAAGFAAAFADVSETDTVTVHGNEVVVSWDAPDTNALTVLHDELERSAGAK